jgi:predicted DNA-binding protein (MmcQ/YjbR family)
MSLHSVKPFSKSALGIKAVTINEQWGSHVAKIGGKTFALLSQDSAHIVFKVSELSFEVLTEVEGIGQAPYFAKRQWVSVEPGSLSDGELKTYIRASYDMIAAKLTRKLRAELGLG